MQRIVRLTAGESVTPMDLVPNDMDYLLATGERCFPCRLIRINVPRASTLHISLKWTETRAALALWANGREFLGTDGSKAEVDADLDVASSELLVYVEQLPMAAYRVPFQISTSLGVSTGP
jgi:hypothetical protein